MKKKLHIIPHTHWDREWYMPLAHHQIRLVELMDTLIDLLENDPSYPYFHLDGQYIILQDYLEFRPEMRERIKQLIQDKRLIVGPWYVLQDEYLTSGESNIRNLLLGIEKTKEFGNPLMIGYFPDSFGNISQAPQILRGFNIDRAVFGRGLTNLGPDNAVKEGQGTQSELIWGSPDGSEVVAILFANWYHNAMELPSDDAALKERIEKIVKNTERFATTKELLGMNGCDHQPIQLDLAEVIQKANTLFDDVEIIHSHFDKYFDAFLKHKPKLEKHTGEIAGQYTNGWYLLVSTASTRVHTKFLNYLAQYKLTKEVEPLLVYTSFFLPKNYNPILKQNWFKLMENHPHDTICGCSNDRTMEDMEIMLKRSIDMSEGIIFDVENKLKMADQNKDAFVLIKGVLTPIKEKIVVQYDRPIDEENPPQDFELISPTNEIIQPKVTVVGKTFDYDLPDNAFRKPYFVSRYLLEFIVDISGGFGAYRYQVIPKEKPLLRENPFILGDNYVESDMVKLSWFDDGSITLYDKLIKQTHSRLNIYEDRGDRGNEYEYIETVDLKAFYSSANKTHNFSVIETTPHYIKILHTFTWAIPKDMVKDSKNHKRLEQTIETTYTIYNYTSRVDVDVTIDNQHKNHRLRALFPTFKDIEVVYAEGQYDIVKRNIKPWAGWKNPSNLQRFETFVYTKNDDYGLMIASKGIHEYEVIRDDNNTLAITLMRCVAEMGDWGVFPTPNAQLLGIQKAAYSIQLFDIQETEQAIQNAYAYAHLPLVQTISTSNMPYINESLISVDDAYIATGAIKPASIDYQTVIVRLINLSEHPKDVTVTIHQDFNEVYQTNLNEDIIEKFHKTALNNITLRFKGKQILTLSLKRTKQ